MNARNLDFQEEKRPFIIQELDDGSSFLDQLRDKTKRYFPEGLLISDYHQGQIDIIASNKEIPGVVYGETGTGKEEIAKLIHKKREKSGKCPFVSVNCANLTTDLASSLLFGHCRGAFTGADKSTNGLIGEANGGILFLDEIHTLSRENQTRLLRVLNDGKYTRTGETIERTSKFQLIAASTKDLYNEVEQGRFLLDLRIRIMGIDIYLPPLRERLEDLPALIALFLVKHDVNISKQETESLIRKCSSFHWQGNIRQLYKVLYTWIISSSYQKQVLRASDLPIFKSMEAPRTKSALPLEALGKSGISTDELSPIIEGLRRDMPLKDVMEEMEKLIIRASLSRHRRITDVYRGLEISRNTLDLKRKKYGL